MDTGDLFGIDSYEAILYGMDFLRDECDEWFGPVRSPSLIAAPIRDRLAMAPQKLPPHALWLQRAVGMPAWTAAGAKP